MREVWDQHWWQDTVDTITDRDILYMVDEMKLEYIVPLIETMQGKVNTIEVGSGSGRLSCFLASKGYYTTCLDYSRNALRVAANNYLMMENEGNFILADAESLPFKNGSFEVVLSTGLLEHFVDAQLVVDEMARILKPGGYFISDIVPKKLLALYMSVHRLRGVIVSTKLCRRGSEERIYEGRLSKGDIKVWLRTAGLHDINVFAAGVIPPPLPLVGVIPNGKRARRTYNALAYYLKPFFKRLDNTVLAELFGLYYFAHAKKPDAKVT